MISRTSRAAGSKTIMLALLMAVAGLRATVAIAGLNEDLFEASKSGGLLIWLDI